MTSRGNQSRRRLGGLATIAGYVTGLVGTGALIATLVLLSQVDARQQAQLREIESLQEQLASLESAGGPAAQTDAQTDASAAVQPGAQPAAQTAATSVTARGDNLPEENGARVTGMLQEIQRRLSVLEAEASRPRLTSRETTRLLERLSQWESRLAETTTDVEPNGNATGGYDRLAQDYDALKSDFQQQAEQLLANQTELNALRQQIREISSRQTVLRSAPVELNGSTDPSDEALADVPSRGARATGEQGGSADSSRTSARQSGDDPDVTVISRKRLEITAFPPAPDAAIRSRNTVDSTDDPRVITTYPGSLQGYP